MARVPHFTHPVRMTSGGLAVADQDTPSDVASCLERAALYRPGDLEADPQFGLPDPTFTEPESEDIRNALERMEPRARILVESEPDRYDELVRRVTVTMTADPVATGEQEGQ